MKNMTFAIPAAASDMPPKPRIPATIAITIQTINHFSITESFRIVTTNYDLEIRLPNNGGVLILNLVKTTCLNIFCRA